MVFPFLNVIPPALFVKIKAELNGPAKAIAEAFNVPSVNLVEVVIP